MSPAAPTEGMETRLALVEKELGMVHGIFQRFESALEKISESSASVQKLLAVHDQRLSERERAETALFESIERRRDEYATGVEKVYHKMDDMANEIKKQVRDELSEMSARVKITLDEFKESQKTSTSDRETEYKEMDKRVRALENWRWLIAGGSGVLGFLIAKWPLVSAVFGAG